MNERRPAWPVERTLLLPVAAILLAVWGTAAIVSSAARRDTTAAVTSLLAQVARDSEAAPLDPAAARTLARVLEQRDDVARADLGAIHGSGTVISAPIRLTTGMATLQVETKPRPAANLTIAIAATVAALLGTIAAYFAMRRKLLAVAEDPRPHRGALGAIVDAANDLLGRVQDRELTLRRRTVELEAANKELEAFTYSVSHDLRAPIGAIDGFSQALDDENLSATGRECVYWIRDSCKQMHDLVDGLLQMSRLARTEVEREDFDASELARSVAESLRQREPERAVDFRIQDGIHVNADPRLMRAVLENLMANAWKFTRKHEKATIEFGAQNGHLFVRDDGAGFDPGHAANLFRAFQRLHSRDDFEGTGIGLATVERILHRHGGKIWAEGEVEKGATFYFTTGKA